MRVGYVFLVPGSQIKGLCIALEKFPSIQVIVACHEAGAGYMADGYSRVKKTLGVALSIGSPGMANLLGSMLNAKADCSKVLYLIGSISTDEDDDFSFQNTGKHGSNDSAIMACALGFSNMCNHTDLISPLWDNAMLVMNRGLPRPTYIIIPEDIQLQEMNKSALTINPSGLDFNHAVKMENLEHLLDEYLKKKTRICILIGRGVEISGAEKAILQFIEKYQIPFISSLGGKGILPETHPLFIGLLGYSGKTNISHQRALDVLRSQQLDVLISIGSNLSFFPRLYGDGKKVLSAELVQININAAALERNISIRFKMQADAKACLDYLNNLDISELTSSMMQRQKWIQKILSRPLFVEKNTSKKNEESIDIIYLVRTLNNFMPDNTLLFIDSGSHAAVAAHYWLTKEGGGVIRSSNVSPMGFAIPAAIGGKLAAPDHPVVVFTGDGCMRMHGVEIISAVQYQMPIIIIVCNNSCLGSKYANNQNTLITDGKIPFLSEANWADFARSLGADGVRILNPKDLLSAYQHALLAKGPFVIDVVTKH